MEEKIVNQENFEKFKKEVGDFSYIARDLKAEPPVFTISKFENYLKYCEIQRLDKLIKLMETK